MIRRKARDVANKVLLKIEALREPAIGWRSRLAIAILLVTFLLKKSNINNSKAL